MASEAGGAPELLETGVPNLDRILGGGLPRRSTLMVIGAPGSGKTILALQFTFHTAAPTAYPLPHGGDGPAPKPVVLAPGELHTALGIRTADYRHGHLSIAEQSLA